jgi:hypothetical protein
MMKKYWKFNLHLCQEQLRNVRVSQFSRAHCECMSRFASFGTTHVIHCIITKFAYLSGNKFMNWCPSSRLVFKSIKLIFHCSWAVHLERNISFKESIHNCKCGFPWFRLVIIDHLLFKTSKSPHAFAMCSIRTDLLKQENEKIDSL